MSTQLFNNPVHTFCPEKVCKNCSLFTVRTILNADIVNFFTLITIQTIFVQSYLLDKLRNCPKCRLYFLAKI